ncbi:lamin tail domain-containing protein, partial [Chloroflexota bacterium]
PIGGVTLIAPNPGAGRPFLTMATDPSKITVSAGAELWGIYYLDETVPGGEWLYYIPEFMGSTLVQLEPDEFYYIVVSAPCTLTILQGEEDATNGDTIPPTVNSVTPNSGNQGQTLSIIINGTDFTGATAVSFGTGMTVNSFIVNSDNLITTDVTIAEGAITGLRNVSVTTTSGTGTLNSGFTVEEAEQVTSPFSGTVTINGVAAPIDTYIEIYVGVELEVATATTTAGWYEVVIFGTVEDVGRQVTFMVDGLPALTTPSVPLFAYYSPQTVNLAANTGVTTYTLTVNVSPAVGGSVIVDPPGLIYPANALVTLTATAASGHNFSFWSGDASGTNSVTTVFMTGNKSITANFSEAPSCDTLFVHFIDVGQGDSILLDSGSTEVLIDGGDKTPGVVSYIDDYVDGNIEIVVATHPHADHIGGLIGVFGSFEVDQVWLNGDTSPSQTYSEFMSAVYSEGAQIYEARRGDIISAGNLYFDVLHPTNLSGSTNNNSVVLSLNYGQIDFLFTGDAEQEAESSMLGAGVVPYVEILKVGHHGSSTASSIPFLDAVQPEVAIYMAGEGNPYGHPHNETLTALDNIGADIYGTDINGTIVVTVDCESYILPSLITTTPQSPSPSPTPSPTADVKITKIFYDGLVPSVESDEYVEITNLGNQAENLANWVLRDISEGYPSFTFPSHNLQPGQSVRVYTNEIHPEYGGFSFGYGNAIWNNSDPDTAALYNAQGQEVSRKSY